MVQPIRIAWLGILLAWPGYVAGQEAIATAPQLAATVNGHPIPMTAVQRALRAVPADKHAEAKQEILKFLIDNALVEQYLVSTRIAVPPTEVQARMKDLQSQLQKQKLEYGKVLKDMMLTERELAGHIAAELRWEKYVNSRVNEPSLRQLFQQNKDMFDGTVVRARHILLTPDSGNPQAVAQASQKLAGVRKNIEYQLAQALAKLPANTDNLGRERVRAQTLDKAFANQAAAHSTCPSKKQGGDVGWFPRFGGMVEAFAQAAFAMKPYEISGVVRTQFGLHLVMVTARKPGKPDVKFEDVKDRVREYFAYQLRANMTKELRKKAKIVVK